MNFFLLVSAGLAFVIACEAATHFCYDKEKECSTWLDDACQKGQQQSPIDINTVAVKSQKEIRDSFSFNTGYRTGTPSKSYITNNGHTVQLSATRDATSTMTFIDENEQTTYVFGQVHCHWESEHKINGQTYGLECHFVHYNSKYDNITHAVTNQKQGALAIFGVLFKRERQIKSDNFLSKVINSIIPSENPENLNMKPITDNLDQKSGAGNKTNDAVEINSGFNVLKMINPTEAREVEAYHYIGSLTTPACNEGMRWFVLKNPQTLSDEQWKAFEKVQNGEGEEMKGNRRPIQSLNGRTVKLVKILFK